MFPTKSIRAGILFAIAAASTLSCGETQFTEPNPKTDVVAVRTFEHYLTSPQRETRELLIDGRVTDIEWNVTGDPSIVLLEGQAGGGNYYVSIRSLWTTGPPPLQIPNAIYFLVQWPDGTQDLLQEPLVTSADVYSDDGLKLIDCATSDALIRESSWSRSTLQEDQVTLEIFSDSVGSYPADVWRWGAGTTDPVTPVNCAEFVGACQDGDSLGSTTHPTAGYMEDLYDLGGGPVRDQGDWTYKRTNHNPGSNVPLRIADKGTRDTRLNRAKPTAYVLWDTVAKNFGRCDSLNPIRLDDASVRDKSWNPGDYVPSFRAAFPTLSQRDVIARGSWLTGKWGVEIRRDLIARPPAPSDTLTTPWPDDVQLVPGRRYMLRVTIFDGATKSSSRSALIPLYLRP